MNLTTTRIFNDTGVDAYHPLLDQTQTHPLSYKKTVSFPKRDGTNRTIFSFYQEKKGNNDIVGIDLAENRTTPAYKPLGPWPQECAQCHSWLW